MKRLLVILGLSLSGCVAFVPEPTAQMAGGDDARLAELRAGRELYVSKCSGCHSLYDVNRFPASRWAAEVQEMIQLKKVRLAAEERERLILYLTVASGQH